MYKIINFVLLVSVNAYASMLIGAGGFDVIKKAEQYLFRDANKSKTIVNITQVLNKEAKNVNAVSMWITKDWKEFWYDAKTVQKEIVDKGYTPVFIFYWFADEVSVEFIRKHEKEYFALLKKFTSYLKTIHGQKIVVLNPEYNMGGVEKWEGMNDIFLKSFKILRDDPQVLVGPCVGDFGNYAYVDEPNEWKLFDASLHRAAKASDFIAFQEMRGLTRNTKKDILLTPDRALHFSQYLHNTYHKPTLLAYVAISTYGKDGEDIQAGVFKKFLHTLPLMEEKADLLYFGIFHYFDYPGHVGYFNEAEEYFGVVENNGTKKESFKYFKELH